jgi:hypothetical protein
MTSRTMELGFTSFINFNSSTFAFCSLMNNFHNSMIQIPIMTCFNSSLNNVMDRWLGFDWLFKKLCQCSINLTRESNLVDNTSLQLSVTQETNIG